MFPAKSGAGITTAGVGKSVRSGFKDKTPRMCRGQAHE